MLRLVSRRLLSTAAPRLAAADAAAAATAPKPPIHIYGVSGRYAHALYTAAAKKQAAPRVEKELAEVKNRLSKDAVFANFLADPVMSRPQKADLVRKLMAEKKYSDVTQEFFGALAENNRLPEASSIIDSYLKIMAASRGEVECTVTSAQKLDSKTQQSIEGSLNKMVKAGEKVKVSYEVNPQLLGGFQVSMGDQYIDLSVRTKITKYCAMLRESL